MVTLKRGGAVWTFASSYGDTMLHTRMMATQGPHDHTPRRRWGLLRIGVALLAAAGLVAQPLSATAAGSAVITVSATPVHYLDGTPTPTAGMGLNGNRLAYRVSYSCSVAACDGATVRIDPTQLDPNHNFYRLLKYVSWTAPASGGTISGNATTGLTVSLGNLAVGASGTFTLVFNWDTSGSYQVTERSGLPASNFPNNTPLTLSLTADATTANAPYSTTSAASLWQITTPNPGISAATVTNVLADSNYSYQLRMGSGCMSYIDSAAKGNAANLCASDYTVVHQLPPGAVLVSISGDSDPALYNRTYDPIANTITWHAPAWSTSGVTPEVGWHSPSNWTGIKPRTITVRFPAATFAPVGQTCDFTTPVTIASQLSVTYISAPGESGEVRTASDSKTLNVYCVTPFAKAIFDAKVSTFDGTARESTSVSAVVIPNPSATNEKYWRTTIGNQSNVAGTAIHVDNSLDLDGAPVYKITPSINTSSSATLVPDTEAVIQWTATDGSSTQTGTSVGETDIEQLLGVGWRFTSATITSGSLAGPNTVTTGTARTNSIVDYYYRVSPTATPNALRTNTATGTMTYPGTSLSDVALGSRSHSIRFVAPYGEAALVTKDSSNDGTTGQTRLINVPTSGTVNRQWSVQVSNQGNVPGVAVITDNALAQAGTTVYSITASPVAGATATYELDNGVTGSTTLPFTAPTGRYIVKATVTSGAISGPNAVVSQNASSPFTAYFLYRVLASAPIGEYRTNTASATMSYPDYPAISSIDLGSTSRTIRFATTKAVFTAQSNPAPVISGGGSTATPATDVTFSVRGVTSNVYTTVDITPQYVFVAPAGWEITPGSAGFAAGAVPDGVTFSYRTVTISGISRHAVVATWPNSVAFGKNTTWPSMSVVARPTYAVSAGTTSVASAYITDSRHTYTTDEATYNGAFQDTPDLDGDGTSTEYFASTTQSVVVGAAGAMRVLKEICSPNPAATDGCTWISDSTTPVGVAPNSTSIKYRLTIQNAGNTTLSNAVGYDVLPYIGDVGTSDATSGSPRNSDFKETVNTVSDVTSGATATFSTSTNPPRSEVFSGTTSGTWTTTASGASAIRLAYPGNLLPGASVSLVYTANVVGSPVDGDQACNSFAVKITGIGTTSEPAAVCAAIQEADLEITALPHFPLQVGRPSVLPFTVVNNGGSPAATGHVEFSIPAGVSVRSLTPAGWSCVADPSGVSAGPLTLSCDPVDAAGVPRKLAIGAPESIELEVTATAVASTICVDGTISGPTYDATPGNNTASSCSQSFSALTPLIVTKDDSRATVAVGDEYTYSVTVTNGLVGENLADVTLTDALPAGVEFVSAGDGGTESGGVVTWPAFALTAAGLATTTGVTGSGAVGSTFTTTVTVRVLPTATGSIVNTANATTVDPVDSANELSGSDSDTDTLRKASITKSSTASSIGVLAGETLTYTVTVTNSGTAPFTSGSPAVIRDDLAAVLDDASFVAGSASVSVNGAAGTPIVPTGSILSWSGALPVGQSAVLTYRVVVGDGSSGDRVLSNVAFSSPTGTACDTATGRDEDGLSCASRTTPFAPTFTKSIVSSEQLSDGTWRTVYGLDIVNLNAAGSVTYSLSDSLAFGSGIPVASADVTSAPGGVTPASWSGSGTVAASVVLPPGATHHYELTVVTGTFVPAASATCVAGSTGGFGNSATFTPVGGPSTTSFACASPTRATIAKTVAAPTQNADGTWNVVYTVTVTAPAGSPSSGLAYTVDDEFEFPTGVGVGAVSVVGPAGASVNPTFNGTTQRSLLTAADRVVAGTPRVFTITARTSVPAGAVTGSELACPPAGGGGYSNSATLLAGTSTTELGQADACAAVTAQPTPTLTKNVTATSIDEVTGYWTVVYELTVRNPSPSLVTTYDLADEVQFGDGVTIVGTPIIESTDVAPDPDWNGQTNVAIVSGEPLAAGAVHTYTVTVVADTVLVTDENVNDMDCLLAPSETGTGFRNVATLGSGVAPQTFAVGCAPANDPSVVKHTVGTPVQDPDTGTWTVVYEITVTNRATTSPVGGIPYTLTDSFGFPEGTAITDIDVAGPGTINPSFDGGTDSDLASGSLDPAADDSTPTEHVYTVTVEFVAAGGLAPEVQFCEPSQGPGGLRNEVEVAVGSRVTGDVACADSPDVPVAGVGKEVLSQAQQPDGTWVVLYRLTVANPDPTIATVYSLEDRFDLGAGVSLVGPPAVVARPAAATISPTWNGAADTTVVEHMVLPGGGTHTYTVRAVIDSGSVRGSDAAGDCTVDVGESGTGFTNTAAAITGSTERVASACATAQDPSVTKTVAGEPVRNLNGSFTVGYVVTVQNPSADVDLAYGLSDELSFPVGSVFGATDVTARVGSPAASTTWDGVSDPIVIPEGTSLPGGATHVFDVTVTVTLPDDQDSEEGGFANRATVASSTGGVVTSVDDAATDIELPELVITKDSEAAPAVSVGHEVTYTIRVKNVGLGDYTNQFPAEVWDYLAGVLDDATFDGAVAVTPDAGELTVESDRFHWSGPLFAGDEVELAYTVVVTGKGDHDLRNTAYAPVLPGQEPAQPETCDSDRCADLSTPLPGFLLEKRASTGVIAAGSSVTYTVEYTNTGRVDVADATFVDDLADVLDDADFIGAVEPTTGSVEIADSVLTWTGALAAGQTVTVTYSVQVNSPLTGNGTLVNTATADPRFVPSWPGGECPGDAETCEAPDGQIDVTTGIRSLAFTKSSDRTEASGGDRITYTVTVTNIGESDYTEDEPARVVDTMTDVLDDAVYNGDAVAALGSFEFVGTTLMWTGPLAAGESVELSYSVTTNPQVTGDGRVNNIVGVEATGVGIGELDECLAEPTDNAQAFCYTTLEVVIEPQPFGPLAFTGGAVAWLVPGLVALLLILVGFVVTILRVRRARITSTSHSP